MNRIKSIIFLFALLSFSQSYACRCEHAKTLKELQDNSYKYSSMVFLADIIKFDTAAWSYTLRITETFKGDTAIKTITGYYYDSCSLLLSGEGRWLVYGRLREDGNLSIVQCGATRSDIHPYYRLRGPQPIPHSANPKIDPGRRHREALKIWNDELEMLRNKKNRK